MRVYVNLWVGAAAARSRVSYVARCDVSSRANALNAERPPFRVAVLELIANHCFYRSFFRQFTRSPSVVVELETGALWAVSL